MTNIKDYLILVFLALVCLALSVNSLVDLRVPYGYDEIVFTWPVGQALHDSKLIDWPNILISSWFKEDHLMPLSNLLTYLLPLLDNDPVRSVGYMAKIYYLVFILSVLHLAYVTSKKIILSALIVLMVISNQAMSFHFLSFGTQFTLASIFFCFLVSFCVIFLRGGRNYNLIIVFALGVLGSFAFSNFLLVYPFVFLYCGCLLIKLGPKVRDKITKLLLVLTCSGLPYLCLNYIIRGTLIPASRLEGSASSDILTQLFSPPLLVINEILWGFPTVLKDNGETAFAAAMLLLLAPLAIMTSISFKFFKLKERENSISRNITAFALAPAVLMSLLPIMYTGRYHPGMWSVLGAIFYISVFSALDYYRSHRGCGYTKFTMFVGSVVAVSCLISYFSPVHPDIKNDWVRFNSVANSFHLASNSFSSTRPTFIFHSSKRNEVHGLALSLDLDLRGGGRGLFFDAVEGAMKLHPNGKVVRIQSGDVFASIVGSEQHLKSGINLFAVDDHDIVYGLIGDPQSRLKIVGIPLGLNDERTGRGGGDIIGPFGFMRLFESSVGSLVTVTVEFHPGLTPLSIPRLSTERRSFDGVRVGLSSFKFSIPCRPGEMGPIYFSRSMSIPSIKAIEIELIDAPN